MSLLRLPQGIPVMAAVSSLRQILWSSPTEMPLARFCHASYNDPLIFNMSFVAMHVLEDVGGDAGRPDGSFSTKASGVLAPSTMPDY